MECVVETKATVILQFIHGLGGDLHLTLEEGLGCLVARPAVRSGEGTFTGFCTGDEPARLFFPHV